MVVVDPYLRTLHGVTAHKTAIVLVINMRTSSLTITGGHVEDIELSGTRELKLILKK
jgi:hypothetical protein